MAKVIGGPDGQISGKLGNHVAYIVNGECFMRMRAKKRTAKRSAKEKKNHSKFALVQKFMRPLSIFLRVGFNNYGTKTGGYKAAVSFALRQSMEGVYPDQHVNPEMVQVSGGDLYIPAAAEVTMDESYKLTFTWDPAHVGNAMPQDQVMILAYCPDQEVSKQKVFGALRSAGTDTLQLDGHWTEAIYHLYMAFVSGDRGQQSNSVYLGTVTVPAKTG